MIQEQSHTLTILLEGSEINIWFNILDKLKEDLNKIGLKKKFTEEERLLLIELIGKENE